MMAKKEKCILLGVHALLIAGITTGYVCMYQKLKKPKLDLNSLSSHF